jgi:hypothetical protein
MNMGGNFIYFASSSMSLLCSERDSEVYSERNTLSIDWKMFISRERENKKGHS